jgi:hypothetical protein
VHDATNLQPQVIHPRTGDANGLDGQPALRRAAVRQPVGARANVPNSALHGQQRAETHARSNGRAVPPVAARDCHAPLAKTMKVGPCSSYEHGKLLPRSVTQTMSFPRRSSPPHRAKRHSMIYIIPTPPSSGYNESRPNAHAWATAGQDRQEETTSGR